MADSASPNSLDDLDRAIIRTLQAEGRITNQELADRVGLTPSPCLRRVRQLEADGVIRGYAADIDPKAYGLPITAFLRIRLQRHTEDAVRAFEDAVLQTDYVQDCFMMTGDSDYLLRVVVASLEDYEHFVRTQIRVIPSVASLDTSFTYANVKQTAVFPAGPGSQSTFNETPRHAGARGQ